MDAAERCFARQGIAVASIRTIVKEAGVNLGAITYHFGSKENLVVEIFKRRMLPMSEERLAMLDTAQREAGDSPVPLRKVIEAIVIPQRRIARQHPEFIEFLVRMKNYPNPQFYRLIDAEFKMVFQRFDQAVRAALPLIPTPELCIKMHFFIHLLGSTPENDFHLQQVIPEYLDDGTVTDVFVSFIEGGLASPSMTFSQPESQTEGR